MDRREFFEAAGILLGGTACAYGLPLVAVSQLTAGTAEEESAAGGRRWGMVIDLRSCRLNCQACTEACRRENNAALHGDPRWDVHLIRKVQVRRKGAADAALKPLLLLCNQCDRPPCVQACPVQATFQRPDGIVLVDQHRCIGCRYCMIACPYNARHYNYKENPEWPNKDQPRSVHGVPQSCTLCVHRLDQGRKPACVEACERVGAKALAVGDLNDPQSEVSRLIATHPVRVIREDLGTKPKVYYIGL